MSDAPAAAKRPASPLQDNYYTVKRAREDSSASSPTKSSSSSEKPKKKMDDVNMNNEYVIEPFPFVNNHL